jgi:hypothetical protein
MADNTNFRKNRSIIWSVLAGLLLISLLGLLLLPSLMSTDWAGNKAKQVINARSPGQIDFENVSLSWFNGIQYHGITYDDPAKGILIKVADLTTSKGLLAIAINYKEIGTVTIKDPVISVYLNKKNGSDETETVTEKKNTGSPKTTSVEAITGKTDKPAEGGSPIPFPAIAGQLNITGGAVTAVFPDKKEKSLLQDLELQLNVAGLEGLLEYLISFQSGDGTGQVKGAGTVTLPAEDISMLNKIQSQATVDIENWEIEDLLSLLAATAGLPTGSGQLNGHLSISGSTETAIQINGNLTAQQIKLQGGPLKSDTPSLEKVEVAIDGEKTATAFTLNRLELTSPLATGTASGTFDSQNKKEIISEAIIDLAELFAQFPNTLNLKQGTRVSKGKINVDAKITGTDSETVFDTSISLDTLQGIAGKKKITWDKPVTVVARGEQSQGGLRLENFEIQSSFLNSRGKGDINHMQLQLEADIDTALKEIGKFIQLEDWKSSGKVDLNLQINAKTEELRSVAGDVKIKDFVLLQKNRPIAPRSTFKANLATDLRLDRELRPREILDSVLDFQSWIGTGSVTVKSLVPASEQSNTQLKDLAFKGTFDLGQLSTLLQSLGLLPEDTRFTGKTEIYTGLSFKDDTLELGDTTLKTQDFFLKKGKQNFSDKKIHLTTRGSADLKKKTASLRPVDITTTAGQIALPELLITNWDQLEKGIKTSGNINLDLGPLTVLLADVLKLPPDTTVAGQATIKLNLDLTDRQQQSAQLETTLESIKIASSGKQLLSEDTVRLAINLKGDIGDKSFSLDKLEFTTHPIVFNATGRIAPDKQEHLLAAEGTITLNLEAISTYLKSLFDLEIEMTGAKIQPFTVKAKSVDGQWVKIPNNAELSTSMYAESIRGFGLHVESLEVPIQLANSTGQIDIQGTVNRGRMTLKPAIDFTVDPPVISIPENTVILTDVGLSEAMSRDLLAQVHPIFKSAAVSQGTVDLTMQNFSWPLDAAARKDAAFTGSLTFNDVKLQAGGLLAQLLTIMKANEREITLSNQPMQFVGENDRVRCSPLEIKTKEHSLILSGSIGFDQSLDYIAQVPVTRQMVGSDIYKYLEETFITVPIGGTVSKPSISKNLVQRAIKDLIKQAGKKQITDQAGKLLQKLFN